VRLPHGLLFDSESYASHAFFDFTILETMPSYSSSILREARVFYVDGGSGRIS